MPKDITLASLATRTTTTINETHVQPYERDGKGAEAAVDLGDDRSVSLTLAWEPVPEVCQRKPALVVTIEASPDAGISGWTECARFNQISAELQFGPQGQLGSQSIGFTSPARYIRATWLVLARQQHTKDGCRFSVAGRAVGS